MNQKKRCDSKRQEPSVFREAWENMSADMSRLLPKKMRKPGGTRKLFIFFAVIELIVLGVAGSFLYGWLAG